VAIVRTFIFASYLITNIAIVANAVRHWNDNECSSQTAKKEGIALSSRLGEAKQ
jgi:hypothetical protein